jgi:hypothetical protein
MHPISPESTDEPKPSIQGLLYQNFLELTPDGKYVRWVRDHPRHPRNWSGFRKAYDIILVCLLDLFMYDKYQAHGNHSATNNVYRTASSTAGVSENNYSLLLNIGTNMEILVGSSSTSQI